MALTTGSRLGVYDVTEQIGEGGMGQVYRATDTKLKRQVAIKVLPSSVAADPDRLARFQREAEVLASLNHPNVAHIYGLDRQEGPAGQDGTSFIVMELVEGDDLSQRIARGAIPIDEALPIAKQIADALEAAHEQGIIHRDLKPANIKVRPDGTVKVLDFGLAKALGPSKLGPYDPGVGAELAPPDMSPTLSLHATMAGVILGTAAYMSPEQARGKSVDKRADIWAFGVVLFEMLTGRRAFPGEDITDTIVSVVSKEPDWSALPADTPSAIRRVLARCVKKDAKARMRDIGEARLDIEDALTSPAAGAAGPATPNAERRTANDEPRRGRRRTLPATVAAAAMGAATVLVLWSPWRAPTPVDRPLVRLDVDLGADMSLPPLGNAGSNVAISPDGTRLVYASGNPTKLFTRRLDQSKPTELAGTEGAQGPFVSPDGQWIGFVARGRLNKISVEGGAVVSLSEAPSFAGASWGEDGSIILGGGTGSRGLLRIPADGGTPEVLAPMANDGEAARARPQALPGGKAVLFTVSTSGSGDISRFNVEVVTLADRRRKIVARGGSTARYLPTSTGIGHLVYTNYTTLFAVPFDLEKLETRGTAIPVLDDVAYFTTLGAGGLDASRTGTLVYRRAGASVAASGSTLQWVDTAGRRMPLRGTPGFYSNLRLSPDGTRLALLSGEAGLPDVWVYDLQRDAMTRLTFVRSNYGPPRWSPDSQYVVFADFSAGGIFTTRADGASQPALLVPSTLTQSAVPWSFTPDGKRLAYFERAGGSYQLWTVPLENQGGQLKSGTPEPFLKSSFNDLAPAFSPDGRWLAYNSDESGKGEVYVRAFPPPSSGPGAKWLISNTGGTEPIWSRTGHDLLYRSGDQIMAASYTVRGDTFAVEKPRVWIAKLGAVPTNAAWDLAPDGKRVAVVTRLESADAPRQDHEVVFLQNFFDELRRRVPLVK